MQFQLERAALVAATLLAAGLITATLSAQCETDALTGSEGRRGWPFSGDTFTDSVMSLDGDTLVVGIVPLDVDFGIAEVYTRSGTSWTLQQTLGSSAPVVSTAFGAAVAISGDTLVVGEREASPANSHVFVRSAGVWSLQQVLTPSGPGVFFGNAVAIEGDRIVVGARLSATAYVFERSGTTWTETVRRGAGEPLGSTSAACASST